MHIHLWICVKLWAFEKSQKMTLTLTGLFNHSAKVSVHSLHSAALYILQIANYMSVNSKDNKTSVSHTVSHVKVLRLSHSPTTSYYLCVALLSPVFMAVHL